MCVVVLWWRGKNAANLQRMNTIIRFRSGLRVIAQALSCGHSSQGRRCLTPLLMTFCVSTSSVAANDGALTVLRVGTGGTGGTYFPMGSLIAQSISEHREDEGRGPLQGVNGLLAVAQISNGSIANVNGMRRGHLHAALAQADVVYWAYHGMAVFGGQARQENLRVIAHLYPESLHLVARKDSGIARVEDLRGRRVSLDEPGSGTILDARFILENYGLKESDLKSVYLKPHFAVQAVEKGELDAFFVFAGYPVSAINRLAGSVGAVLIPLEGGPVDRILKAHPYFSRGVIPNKTYGLGLIPAGTYKGVGDTPTLEVGAQLVIRSDVDEELVYQMTRALWSEATLTHLQQGHPKGVVVSLQRALDGVSIPLHPGAARFYLEKGMKLPSNQGN